MSRESKNVDIYINNVKYSVDPKIPLGATLYSKGIYAFEKSMRFNRPRGLMVYDWRGPEKIYIEEDFELNPYIAYPEENMHIKINLKPPLPRTLINLFRGYFRVGGYNKWPFNRLWAWNIALKYVDEILPWNKPRIEEAPPKEYPKIININTDVLVVGGGVSGLNAALSSSSTGVKTVLVEADNFFGGYSYLYNDRDLIDGLIEKLKNFNVSLLRNLIFEGFFEDAAIGYKTDTNQLVKFNYKSIIFSTGSYEVPALYENNDLPRTLLVSAILRLLSHGVVPGRRGVVIGSTDRALETALKLYVNGVGVAVIESEYRGPNYDRLMESLKDKKITVYDKVKKIKAFGTDKVEGIRIYRNGESIYMDIDFIAHAPYIAPEVEIIRMAKVDLAFDILLGGFIPIHSLDGSTRIENIFIAGSAGGVIPRDVYSKLASLAGYKAAEYIGKSLPRDYDEILDESISILKSRYSNYFNALNRLSNSFSSGGKYEYYDGSFPTLYEGDYDNIFVCFCTDVTLKDLKHIAVDLNLNVIEHIKRYGGNGTGRCQGRRCLLNTVLAVSKFSRKNPSQVGTIRCRPPYVPIPLYLFGGEEE